ncbi:ROK family transcriptional regulator [candidate division KSB1 bacterium]|nr:ROK family transcriptional regulator [candidate division KSB1 bacterium]
MQRIREINELRVLQAVCKEGLISRASLAKRLKLSRAAITGITHRLENRQLLVEVGKGTSTQRGGRRQVLLALNATAGTILAIEIEREFARFGLLNMNAQIIQQDLLTYLPATPPMFILPPILEKLRTMLQQHNIRNENLLGIGVGIPGILNYKMGSISEAFTLHSWRGFALRHFLEQELGTPAFIENNVKALTLGEHLFGNGRNVSDLVSFWVGDGIGAGIIVNGKLLHGATSSAGEIGYNEYSLDQHNICSTLVHKNQRDWGDLISHSTLRAGIQRGIETGWTTQLTTDGRVEEIITAAEIGDPLALHLLKGLGTLIGTVCANLILCLNPPVLILNGLLFSRTALVANAVRQRVAQGILRSPVEGIEIRTGLLGENAVLIGAAALVLEDLFQLPEYPSPTRAQQIFMGQN